MLPSPTSPISPFCRRNPTASGNNRDAAVDGQKINPFKWYSAGSELKYRTGSFVLSHLWPYMVEVIVGPDENENENTCSSVSMIHPQPSLCPPSLSLDVQFMVNFVVNYMTIDVYLELQSSCSAATRTLRIALALWKPVPVESSLASRSPGTPRRYIPSNRQSRASPSCGPCSC